MSGNRISSLIIKFIPLCLVMFGLTRMDAAPLTVSAQEATQGSTTGVSPCQIVFTQGYSAIYVMDEDGNNRHLLGNEAGFHPVWSPDGTRIAFISADERGLYVMDANGTNLRRLAQNLYRYADLSWSPDGNSIAFISDFSADANGGYTRLNLVDVDSGGLHRIGDKAGYYGNPTWSPDGSQIAFDLELEELPTIQFAKLLLRQAFESQQNIYLIIPDGSDVQLLVRNGSFPHWSPDGGQLAFTRREKNTDIYLVDADGSNERVLVSGGEDDYYPRWSPAGTRLTFVSGDFGAEGIHVIDANGSNLRNLTNREGQHSVPDWSPDGRRIAFVSRLEDSIWNDIWVVEVDSANLYPLTDGGQWENPKWSPACTNE